MKKTTKSQKDLKKFYAFGTYKPTKNAVPVNYKGKTYLSKAQCMALEGITRKDLDAYLLGQEALPTLEDVAIEESFDENEDELQQDILAEAHQSLDDLL